MENDTLYQEHIDAEIRSKFEEYLSKNWQYFGHEVYHNEEVDALYNVMYAFTLVVSKRHFQLKKSLLEFQANMLKHNKCNTDHKGILFSATSNLSFDNL